MEIINKQNYILMKKFNSLIFILLAGLFAMEAQEGPSLISLSDPVEYVAPLSSRQSLPVPPVHLGEVNPRHSGQNTVVPGKGLPKGQDPLIQNFTRSVNHTALNPILTFPAAYANASPSDPTGAAGPNHYVVAYNIAFKIFDKNGNVLVNDTNLSALFNNNYSDGDPIVLYDRFADRYLITEFDLTSSPNKFLVAISQTNDPVNGGWYKYSFDVSGGMPDYPKFSIWSDGYYITTNKDAQTASSSEVVYVMNRDQMINGASNVQMVGFSLPGIAINGFYSPSGFNVNGNTLPPAGNAPIIYMQDDSWSGVSQDHLKIWNINMDWANPSNSTISAPQQVNTAPFNAVFNNGGFQNLPQPNGTSIDALQATIMFMTNYRRFPSYNSVVLNFVVNTDGNGKAGIRWFELRQNNDGDPWTVYQEGTFIDPSNHNTFAGSINMDQLGNIGLGYTIVDTNQVPELHYTGRYASDPLGQMTIAPTTVVPGNLSDPNYRYGDYAQLTVDPADDRTFWFISEYFTPQGRTDQVAVFKIASNLDNDLGVSEIVSPVDATLSNNEQIKVTITNYGVQAQTNFPVSYQIDGGAVVTENFTGTIAPGATADYTFSTTADMSVIGHTYTITAMTALPNDQDSSNDALTVNVTNLEPDDMGVTAIVAPVSDTGLTANETVEITLKNFGGVTQSNVPVSYTVDGNTVNEVAPGPFTPGSEQNYTFSQTADLSAIGPHQMSASTALPNDVDSSNDTFSTVITHFNCQPTSNCTYGDQIQYVHFWQIDNTSGCGTDGYEDFTDQMTELKRDHTTTMTITVGYSQEHFKAWIDFNDDFMFDDSEIIVPDYEFEPNGNTAGTFTNNFDVNIPANANLGEHLMRLRTNWQAQVPDACTNVGYGETEDYKVKIVNQLGTDIFTGSEFILQTLSNNHYYLVIDNTPVNQILNLEVYTMGGKQIIYHRLKKHNGKYIYDLDLSYVSKGVYLLKVGNENGGRIRKLIVK